jgi:hypothetical protein
MELADVFCRGSRRKVDQLFDQLWGNHDVEAYRTAMEVLDGEHVWMERLIGNVYPGAGGVKSAPPIAAAARQGAAAG